jgi:hypothetical protein
MGLSKPVQGLLYIYLLEKNKQFISYFGQAFVVIQKINVREFR